MSITISQQYAKIDIKTTPGKLDMQSTRPELDMHQKHAKVNIETELPKVQIDQYECFAEEGLKNLRDLTEEMSSLAQQNIAQYISKVVSDGDTLAAIENKGGNPIAEISASDPTAGREYGLVTMPTSRPKITVTGSIKIEAEPNGQGTTNGVEFQFKPGKLDINYIPGKVETYLRQKPMIEISYQPDKKIDIKV